jgi:hexosaminidase
MFINRFFLFVVSGFLLVSHCLSAADLPFPFKILPQPHAVELLGKSGPALTSLQWITRTDGKALPVMDRCLAGLPDGRGNANNTIMLEVDSSIDMAAEGYRLVINTGGVSITAKDEAGLFYGCQSLEQLMEDALQYKKPLPSCIITDYPAMKYRAVHFDVKHHLDHMKYYYESIDRLARYKINAVIFELEDKLRYQLQPLVGAPQAISIDEMAALTVYARQRHIEITPLVQGLGHASFILKHEAYAGLRELPYNSWAFCPLHEGTYQVLFDLYRDAIKATPGSVYLHIGGDEIGNIGLCPRCKPTADKDGMMSLNLYWLKRVCAFAKENNRIPIFWDDMPLQHAGLYKSTWSDEVSEAEAKAAWQKGRPLLDSLLVDFPKNCVYMRWNYSMAKQTGNLLALDWYQQHGLNAMVATATNLEGGMFFQEDERNKGAASAGTIAIKSFIELAAARRINGMLCTAWDDKSPHMENYWPGFIAAAEYSWHPNGRTVNDFDEAWLQKEFGLRVPDYKQLHDQLRAGTVLWNEAFFLKGDIFDSQNMLQSLKQVEHWLPPMKGRENLPGDYALKLITLPDTAKPGSWTNTYRDKLQQAAAVANRYPVLQQRLRVFYNMAGSNKYYWKLQMVLNKFQTTSPALLLALQKADRATGAERQQGKLAVRDAVLAFRQAWNELQDVYSETRFVAYPENYVPDHYFHLASQREDLSWMIQAQELMIQKIYAWLN